MSERGNADDMVCGYSPEYLSPAKLGDHSLGAEGKKREIAIQQSSEWTKHLGPMIENDDKFLTEQLQNSINSNPGNWFDSSLKASPAHSFDMILSNLRSDFLSNSLDVALSQRTYCIDWEKFHGGYHLLKQMQKRRRIDVFKVIFKVKYPQVMVVYGACGASDVDSLTIWIPLGFRVENIKLLASALDIEDVAVKIVDRLEGPILQSVAALPECAISTRELNDNIHCNDCDGTASKLAEVWQFARIDDDRVVIPVVFVDSPAATTGEPKDEKSSNDLPTAIPNINIQKFMEEHPRTVHVRMEYDPAASSKFEVIVAVPAVGWTPLTEDPIPDVIEGFPVRLVAGYMQPCSGLWQHDRIYPGLAIGAVGLQVFGTIGGYVRIHGQLHIITCAHVMCTNPHDPTTIIPAGTEVVHSPAPALRLAQQDIQQPIVIGHLVGAVHNARYGDVALIRVRDGIEAPLVMHTEWDFGCLTPPELVFDMGFIGDPPQIFSYNVIFNDENIRTAPRPVTSRGAGAVSTPCTTRLAQQPVPTPIGTLYKGDNGMNQGDSGMLFWTANFEREPNGRLRFREEMDAEKLAVGMGCSSYSEVHIDGNTRCYTLVSPTPTVIEAVAAIILQFALLQQIAL